MAAGAHYIIRGGVQGRERLRFVSRVMRQSTLALLERVGLQPGMICLEAGCGGGDVAFDIARMVGPQGRVTGVDIDETKLELARAEAIELQLGNVDFRPVNVAQEVLEGPFDLIHARFLLTHLPDPASVLTKIWSALKPGGILAVADVDFTGYFCYPDNPSFRRYVELYTRAAERRGADANIGPRLPSLLSEAGFENVDMNVVQLASTTGEVKLLTPLTMENIGDSVVAEALATREEVDQLVKDLYEFANTPGTIGCTPRIVEAWGRRPS